MGNNVCCGDGLYGAGDFIVGKAPNHNDAKKTNATASHNTLLKQQEERGENHEYLTRAQDVIKGTVIMFSGCQDSQTSADVSDVTSFGLPTVSAVEKAGGACTNGLLSTLKDSPYLSFGDLLTQMQEKLKKRGYTQIPQLSSSRPINLKEQKFSVKHPSNTGSTRALLIGINYTGHKQGELDGCVNDAKMMRNYLLNNGYSPEADSMRMLIDESCPEQDALPTADNIVNGMNWLVGGALPGDSLFLHYSGHGGQAVDSSEGGDEEDGMDETLVPLDYQDAGQIIDDTIYQLLVAPLPRGVNLVCVFDCCHSGTILDLPFIFSATEENVAAVKTGEIESVNHNAAFSFSTAAGLLEAAKHGVFNQLSKAKHKKPVVMALASKVASKAGSAASSAASTVKLLGGSIIRGGSLQNALSLLSKGGKPGAVAARGGDFKANVARAAALQGDDVVFEKVMQPDSLPGTPLRGPAEDPDSLDSSFSSIGSRNNNNNNQQKSNGDGEMSSFASSSMASLGNVMIQEKAESEGMTGSGSLSRPQRSPSTSSLGSSTVATPNKAFGTPAQSDSDDDGL